MVIFPKAKINLGLWITGKRTDGYHDIESVFYPVDLCDALEFVVSRETGVEDNLTVTGLLAGEPPEDNLVMKAVKLLRNYVSFPALKIHLHKAIPAGAGLGGGSSDAAAIITGINRYFALNIPVEKLHDIALQTGSDCPFFIECLPAIVRGRGEKLETVDPFLKGYYLIILNPRIYISTREAYLNCSPEKPAESLINIIRLPVSDWKDVLVNEFEGYAFKKYPFTGEIKRELYEAGALFSSMSGSGSTVYGVFRTKTALPEKIREYVIFEGRL